MKPLSLLFATVVTVLIPARTFAATYVVRPDGTGDFPTIQEAIDATVDADTVELADGIFTGSGNRDIDYLGKAITVRSQNNDTETCVIDCEGTEADPHRGFFFQSGEGHESVLQAVTILNGYDDEVGGGIVCSGSSPSIMGCTLTGNIAVLGCGLFAWNSSPTLTSCTFSGNGGDLSSHENGEGGGLSCHESSLTLTDCIFSENSAGSGGGIFSWNCALELQGCTFSGNVATEGWETGIGGGMYCYGGSLMLTDCLFRNNTAGWMGGAVVVWSISIPTFTDCEFSANSAAIEGGANYWDQSSPKLTSCVFHENSAVHNGGAAYGHASSPTFTSCTFSENTAGIGGALAGSYYSTSTLLGCTFSRNRADDGSGMSCDENSAFMLYDTIIAFGVQGSAVYCHDTGSTVTGTCCDVYGNSGGDWVGCIEDQQASNGNFSDDPLFCDIYAGDLRLCANSPCLPEHSPCEELIGAHGEGCGNCDTAARTVTWGGIKAEFR